MDATGMVIYNGRIEVFVQHGRRVAADGEERGMAERNLAAVAEQMSRPLTALI
jgi:hypothetical protein